MDSGSYVLLIRLSRKARATVGRLGEIQLRRGWYVYAGSAMRGLASRINRHRRHNKKRHWHIDYLLEHPAARLAAWKAFPGVEKEECRLNREVRRLPRAEPAPRGFGSSDCCNGCQAHLTYFSRKPDLSKLSLCSETKGQHA